jgi:thymidylate synthase
MSSVEDEIKAMALNDRVDLNNQTVDLNSQTVDSNSHFPSENLEEEQYLNLIRHILDNGTWEEGRNGRTKSVFGSMMRFSLQGGKIPILTTKKTAWKTCLRELLWFIKGDMDNRILKAQNVHIWDANGSREFLDSRGLQHYEVDELATIYGYQWRHFNAPYITRAEKKAAEKLPLDDPTRDYYLMEPKGVDQLQQIIDALKDPSQRTSRRLIMTSWNPCQVDQASLPPCHCFIQFNVHNGNQLSCAMYQRSSDKFLGEPINIASYSFLTHLLAKHCGLEAYEFVHFIGNSHIYENAIDACKLQLTRKPYPFPTVNIKCIKENINDYTEHDFEVFNYVSHDAIKVDMIA